MMAGIPQGSVADFRFPADTYIVAVEVHVEVGRRVDKKVGDLFVRALPRTE
jgi:hypothetical protein